MPVLLLLTISYFLFPGLEALSHPLVRRGNFSVGQAVQTSSGAILGHAATSRTRVSEYLGIPYAQPPVAALRFAAPKPFQGNGTITASKFSPDCPANTGNPAFASPAFLNSLAGPNAIQLLLEQGQFGNTQSEDCLTLNVWSKPQTGEKSKAVLVWLYGGGFATGSSDNIGYNGQYFADSQDVVVVSINYRVNIFGFPGLTNSTIPQNPGLLDQRLAVEWVKKNIAGFGGDPERITLFGQSAGAASVDYYSYAYVDDPIVNAFILQSGTATSFSDPVALNNYQAWFNASKQLGCGDASVRAEQSIACMRNQSTQSLLGAIAIANPLQAVLGNFGPTADNKVVFSDYKARAAKGQFVKRPYFAGNNNYEAGLFRLFGSVSGLNITDIAWCLFNLEVFTCPAARAATARALAGVPTYRYRYYGEFPNMRLTANSGAWHGSEIQVVFGTSIDASGGPNTDPETSISSNLQGAWAAFAKDPQGAFTKEPYRYPRFDALAPTLIKLADANRTDPTFGLPLETDALCPVLEAIEAVVPGGVVGSLFITGKILDFSAIPGAGNIPGLSNLTSIVNQFVGGSLPNPSRCPNSLG